METEIYDVMIIGGGIAGLRATIEAESFGVKSVLVSKDSLEQSGNTILSRSGFSVPGLNIQDSPHLFFKDTYKSGYNIGDKKLIKILALETLSAVNELKKWGVEFEISKKKFKLYLTGGHSIPRTIYTSNKTGRDILFILKERINNSSTKIFYNYYVKSIKKLRNGGFLVSAFNIENLAQLNFITKTVVIATGGWGYIFQYSRNYNGATGEGLKLAWELGAELIDMEFIQFYPFTVQKPILKNLGVDIAASIIATGGRLLNNKDQEFLSKYTPEGNLATRDVQARAEFFEIERGNGVKNGVIFDLSGVPKKMLKKALPDYFKYFQEKKIKKQNWKVIVAPSAHYCMGGDKNKRAWRKRRRGIICLW